MWFGGSRCGDLIVGASGLPPGSRLPATASDDVNAAPPKPTLLFGAVRTRLGLRMRNARANSAIIVITNVARACEGAATRTGSSGD